MRFDTPATTNPIDRLTVVGQPVDRIDGPLKTTGRALYAYEQRDGMAAPAYGFILGAAVAKGRIESMDLAAASAAPGVLAIVTAANAGRLGIGEFYIDRPLAGPSVDHYHQAVALVVAQTFEQARAAAALIRVDYTRAPGAFDLAAAKDDAPTAKQGEFGPPPRTAVGDFDAAFRAAPLKIDVTCTTPDQAHAMMEPHATLAAWQGDQLTCWSPVQQLNWGTRDLAVVSQHVVPIEAKASDGWTVGEGRVWSMPVVVLHPRPEFDGSMV